MPFRVWVLGGGGGGTWVNVLLLGKYPSRVWVSNSSRSQGQGNVVLDADGRTELKKKQKKNLTTKTVLCSAFSSFKLPINFVCLGESHSRVVKLGFSVLQLFASESKSGLKQTRIPAGIRHLQGNLLCDAISSYLFIYLFIYYLCIYLFSIYFTVMQYWSADTSNMMNVHVFSSFGRRLCPMRFFD